MGAPSMTSSPARPSPRACRSRWASSFSAFPWRCGRVQIEQLGNDRAGRPGHDLFGRAGLKNVPTNQQAHPVRQPDHVVEVMSHQDHRHDNSRRSSTRSRRRRRRGHPVHGGERLVSNSTSGRRASARATATRCCWPPERCAGRRSSSPSRCMRLSSSSLGCARTILTRPRRGLLIRYHVRAFWLDWASQA